MVASAASAEFRIVWDVGKFIGPNTTLNVVILSEAKDLLSPALTRKQVLRFAQDDKSISE
jgi:hypothetical protein